jgi:hypothetical protein
MVSVRFVDMPEQEQQQEVGEEQQYSSSSKQSVLEDVVKSMAMVRDDQQSSSLVHSPKARRASYARQRRTGCASQLAVVGIENPLQSPSRKGSKLVIPRPLKERARPSPS